MAGLREAIARHLYEWRGIDCAAEQVIAGLQALPTDQACQTSRSE